MENVSPHLSYEEIVRSDTAKRKNIKNEPSSFQLTRIKILAEKVFEPLRNHFNIPINISSCFRSTMLNAMMGGARDSQHMADNGAAIDLDNDVYINSSVNNTDIFNYIHDNLDYDQLIWEFGNDLKPDWVHVSYTKGKNRKETLRSIRGKRGVEYITFKIQQNGFLKIQ
jgi:zinc D-Ala-D-Ala carboxypeptidase